MQYLSDFLFRCLPSGLLIFLFIEANLTFKYNRYLQISVGIVVYYIVGVIGQYCRQNYNIASVEFFVFFGVLLCYSIFFHKETLRYRVFIGVLTILISVICDSIMAVILFYLFPSLDYQVGHTSLPEFIGVYTIYFLFGIIFYSVYLIIKKIRFSESLNKKALIFILFPVSQFLIFEVLAKILINNSELITVEMIMLIAVCFVVSVISDIFCYRGLIQNSQLHETKMRNEQLEYERNTQYRYYEKISGLQHEMMKYRHDFKNALATAYALCDNMATAGEGKNILDELSRKNDENKPPFFCANPIANTILWDKSKIATEKGITLEADASLGEDTGVDGVDICCLIVNMLDNAIRGAENADGEKEIKVKIKEENERIYMSVSNSADMPDFETSDKLPSTKKQKNHGYGTEIIKSIVQKYDGEVLFGCNKKVFTSALSIRKDISACT